MMQLHRHSSLQESYLRQLARRRGCGASLDLLKEITVLRKDREHVVQ